MTTYTETINVDVTGLGEVEAMNNALTLLKRTVNSVKTTSINVKGLTGYNNTLRQYESLINTMGKKVNLSSMSNLISEFNKLQNISSKKTRINVDNSSIEKAVKSIDRLTSQIKKLDQTAKGVNFKNIGNDNGKVNKLQQEVARLNTELNKLKANGNVAVNVKGSVPNAYGYPYGRFNRSGYSSGYGYGAVTAGDRYGGRGWNAFGFNAMYDYRYQYGSAMKQAGMRLTRFAEKTQMIGANLAMFASYAGVHKVTDMLIDTPARAEVQKYLLGNMQGEEVTHFQKGNVAGLTKGQEASLYTITDKVTDTLPISMQNVVNPLYALQAATGANAQEMADVIPQVANFGAQVLNMTGSQERAETAMEKLAYGFNGQFQALDQYGISEMALKNHGFDTSKLGKKEYLGEFMDVVTEITGDATKSMNNFNGLKALVGKDFSRSGKKVWNEFLGPLATAGLRGFHELDQSLGGVPTSLLTVGSAAVSVATSLTSIVGAAGSSIGALAEFTSLFRAMRLNGGGIRGFFSALKNSRFNSLNMYGPGLTGYPTAGLDFQDNAQLASIDAKATAILSAVESGNAIQARRELESAEIGYGKNQMLPSKKRALDRKIKSGYYPYDAMDGYRGKDLATSMALMKNPKVEVPDEYVKDKNKQVYWKRDVTSKYDKDRQPNRFRKKLSKWGFSLTKNDGSMTSFGKTVTKTGSALRSFGSGLASIVTSQWMLLPLLLAVGAGLNFYNQGLQKSEKLQQAQTKFNQALDHAKTSILTTLGNAFQNQGWTTSGGEEGTYEALAKSVEKLADAIYSLPFVFKPDDYYTDFENPEDDPNLPYKKDKMWQTDMWNSVLGTLGSDLDRLGVGWLVSGGKSGRGVQDLIDAHFEEERARIRSGEYMDSESRKAKTSANEVNYQNDFVRDDLQNQMMRSYIGTEAYGQVQAKHSRDIPKEPSWWDQITGFFKKDVGGALDKQKDTTVQSDNVTLQGANGGNSKNILDQIWDSLTGGKKVSQGLENSGATNQQEGSLTALKDIRQNNGLQNQVNNGINWLTQSLQGVDFTQASSAIQNVISQGMNAMDWTGISTSISTKLNEIATTTDFTTVGTGLATNISQSIQMGLSNTVIDVSGLINSISNSLSSNTTDFSSKGTEAGNNYKTGLQGGLQGATAVASAEASAILSALDIADEAYAKGKAAGEAYQRGYKDGGGIYSPGFAARSARQEGLYILGFMQQAVSPIYNTAKRMGSGMANGFARTGTLNYDGLSIPSVNKENTAGFIFGNSNNNNNGVRTYNVTQNFNIEKIDSKERAKEVAEYTVQMLKWNNETAGRATEV